MSMRLEGKRALVTGATRGIGEAILRHFIAEGATVTFTGQDFPNEVHRGNEIASELGAEFRILEVRDEGGWQRLSNEFADRPIDILVNNAGGLSFPKKLIDMTLDEWHHDLEVNLTGPFLGMRAFLPGMLARGKGSIINIASISGIRGQPDAPAYQAAKAGLRWLTKNAAIAYATSGVRINIINPGVIATQLQASMPSEREQWFYDRIPMMRLGKPDEIAAAVVFLASDEASYVTGADINVDGGFTV